MKYSGKCVIETPYKFDYGSLYPNLQRAFNFKILITNRIESTTLSIPQDIVANISQTFTSKL